MLSGILLPQCNMCLQDRQSDEEWLVEGSRSASNNEFWTVTIASIAKHWSHLHAQSKGDHRAG